MSLDTLYELRRNNEVHVGNVLVYVYEKTPRKWRFAVQVGGEEIHFAKTWPSQDEAIDEGAMQAIRYVNDIIAGRTNEKLLRAAAASKKGWKKELLEFFAPHGDIGAGIHR